VAEKRKPRWQRILHLEALARDLEQLGEANRRATATPASESVSPPAATAAQPTAADKPTAIGKIILQFSVAPAVLIGLLINTFFPLSLFHYLLIATAAGIYNVPSIIAFTREHKNKWAILALNALGGWTAIAWIGAFVWSLTSLDPPAPQIIYVVAPPSPQPPQSAAPNRGP
jgi:hypothetical protein